MRPFVLGVERCNQSDQRGGPVSHPLTQAEKQAIADCVKEAVAAGAVGFSTSRFTGHRDSTGQLAPGSLADADEVVLIAKGMAEAGGAVLEMINDFSSYDGPSIGLSVCLCGGCLATLLFATSTQCVPLTAPTLCHRGHQLSVAHRWR